MADSHFGHTLPRLDGYGEDNSTCESLVNTTNPAKDAGFFVVCDLRKP